MLCYDVTCYTDQELSNGECVSLDTEMVDNQCYSALLNLTLMQNLATFPDLLRSDEEAFFELLRQIFKLKLGLVNTSIAFLHFLQEDHIDFIEHIVVYVVFVFRRSSEKMRAVDSLIEKVSFTYKSPLEMVDISVEFELEKAAYNLSFSYLSLPYTTAELRVTTGLQSGFEILKRRFNSSDVFPAECSANQTIALTRLHRCPFVGIPLNAFPIEIVYDSLRVYDSTTHSEILKVLPKWEYDMKGNIVFICLNDFLDMYNALRVQKSDQSCVLSWHSFNSHALVVVYSCFMHVFDSW